MQSSNKIVKDNNKYVISLDPGLEGALCLYNLTTDKVIEVLNTPTYKKDKKTWLHGKNIYTKLQEWSLLTNTKRKSMVLTRDFNPKNDGQADAIAIALYYKTLLTKN